MDDKRNRKLVYKFGLNIKLQAIVIQKGQRRPLDTPERKKERREREIERERRREI